MGLSNPLFFNQSVQFIDDFYIEKTGVDDPVARFNAISKILRNTLNIYPELCAQWVFSNPWTYIKERASQHALEQLPLSPECWVSRALTLLVMEDDPENVKEAQKIYALAESKFPDEDFSVILSEWGIKQEFIAALKGGNK